MKKTILALIFVTALISHSVRSTDLFECHDKNHSSCILYGEQYAEPQWHSLKYTLPNYAYSSHGPCVIDILSVNNYNMFKFKSSSKQAMLDFYCWLTDYCYIHGEDDKGIEMEKNGSDGYIGSFISEKFVPGIDDKPSFIGIDVD